MEEFRELGFYIGRKGMVDMTGGGYSAFRHLAFVFFDMKTDVNLRIGDRIFPFRERSGVHFSDFKGQFVRTGVEAFLETPRELIQEMEDATRVLPKVLIRIVSEYCFDLKGRMFAICRWTPNPILVSEGDVVNLQTESVKDSFFLKHCPGRCIHTEFNKNVITDLEWTPGTCWTLFLDHMRIFEILRDGLSQWILGEFSGGLGRMHVGHFVPGDDRRWSIDWPSLLAPLPIADDTKIIPDSVDTYTFEKKAAIHAHLSGSPQTKITRMFPTPILDKIIPGDDDVTAYLVFVETQNWCPLSNHGFPKAFGYNNILLLNEMWQVATLRWPERH